MLDPGGTSSNVLNLVVSHILLINVNKRWLYEFAFIGNDLSSFYLLSSFTRDADSELCLFQGRFLIILIEWEINLLLF